MTDVRWHFDFVSPYSYLQFRMFDRLPAGVRVELKPVLFAALLKHYETKGPAETESKRLHTYRLCRWLATHHGIPFTLPPAHPFNPLRALRLALALRCALPAVGRIFDFIWAEGRDVEDDAEFVALGRALGVDDPLGCVDEPNVKAALRDGTEQAIAAGVFGVPSFEMDRQVFWGVDATGMFLDYLADPKLFDNPEMARYAFLPIGAKRGR